MQEIRSLEDLDPVQQHAARRATIRCWIWCGAALLLLVFVYLGIYR